MLTSSMLTASLFDGFILPAFTYGDKIRVGVKVVKMGQSKDGNNFFKGEMPDGTFRTFSYDVAGVVTDVTVCQIMDKLNK